MSKKAKRDPFQSTKEELYNFNKQYKLKHCKNSNINMKRPELLKIAESFGYDEEKAKVEKKEEKEERVKKIKHKLLQIKVKEGGRFKGVKTPEIVKLEKEILELKKPVKKKVRIKKGKEKDEIKQDGKEMTAEEVKKKYASMQKEIDELLIKAGSIVDRTDKEDKDTRKMLDKVAKLRLKKMRMIKAFKLKERQNK